MIGQTNRASMVKMKSKTSKKYTSIVPLKSYYLRKKKTKTNLYTYIWDAQVLRTTNIIGNQVSPAVPIFDHWRLRSPRDGMDLLGIVGCG